MIQPTVIYLHPNEYSQELHYLFVVKLGRCVGISNNFNDLSDKVCFPNKTEDLNLSVFNMITRINESKVLAKHLSCKSKCKFDGRKCSSEQLWSNENCRCECKKRHACEKDYILNPVACSCKNGKHLESILEDSAITWDKIIESYDEETEAIPINFNETKVACKTQSFYNLLAILIIIIALSLVFTVI